MKKKLSIEEIVQETINHYTNPNNKRAFNSSGCVYNTKDGNHCAVGRCLTEEIKQEGVHWKYNENHHVIVLHNHYDGIDNILDEKYKGHPLKFWILLQSLHDFDSNWTRHELTEKGEKMVAQILEEYGNPK